MNALPPGPTMTDPESGQVFHVGFLVYSAKRMVKNGRRNREKFRVLCVRSGIDLDTASGETDAEFEEMLLAAQAVVDQYGHLYDDAGDLLPVDEA